MKSKVDHRNRVMILERHCDVLEGNCTSRPRPTLLFVITLAVARSRAACSSYVGLVPAAGGLELAVLTQHVTVSADGY